MENDLILALETATRGGSLALLRGKTFLASSTGIADESHSINLLNRIESLLKEANVTLSDVDLFAVAAGPGSFTGLRIGLATMKAFASVFDRPCIGVPTLEAIAFAAGVSVCTYALLPAGRGEVFAQKFLTGPKSSCPVVPAEHVPPQMLFKRIEAVNSIRWAGPGAHLYKELIGQHAVALGITFSEARNETRDVDPLTFDDGSGAVDDKELQWTLAPNEEQLAQFVAILALQRSNDLEEHRAEDLRAIYVRPSDAELNKY